MQPLRPIQLDLSPEKLLTAYANGIFPMADDEGTLHWLQPDPRAILPLDAFRVSRSTRATIRHREFDIRVNTCFEEVIHACADREDGTWISSEIRSAYVTLHKMGFAHCVEAWHAGTLAGGLYGVALGAAFCGESMFHRARNASKVALVALVERLRRRGFRLLDVQFQTPHLVRFGAVEISNADYLKRLRTAIVTPCTFDDDPDPTALRLGEA